MVLYHLRELTIDLVHVLPRISSPDNIINILSLQKPPVVELFLNNKLVGTSSALKTVLAL